MKHKDCFFYNSRVGQWFFFGRSEDELTGLQVAYILSMTDEDIADHVKDDLPVLPGCPFFNTKNNQSYKKLFVIGGYHFFVNIATGSVCRASGKELGNFVYTD